MTEPARRWVVLKARWWECVAAGLPHLIGPRDHFCVVRPEDYAGPSSDRGVRRTDVIVAPHMVPELIPLLCMFPDSIELYETENLLARGDSVNAQRSRKIRALCPNRWLNYSAANAKLFGDEPRPLRPLCPLPFWRRGTPDIDVLHVGSMNNRRATVIRAMKDRGLRVHHAFNVFGAELARLEGRARLLVNVHYYEPGVFESFRVLPALARGTRVLSESSVDNEGVELPITVVPYEALAETAAALLEPK